MLSGLLAGALLCAPAALAQHGGGGGAPGGGGPPGGGGMGGSQMGGGMGGGGPVRGMDGGRIGAPRESFVPQRPSGPQLGLPGRWWDDKRNAKTIALRSDQQKKMDQIFNTNKGTLVILLGNLQHEESKLESMSPAELQDEGRVFAQIDRVEMARAELEKENARILMLVRQQLDPTQLSRLDSEIANLR